MHGIEFIQDLTVILVVAGVVGWVCQKLGLSAVVGFLAAGMIVGPHTPMSLISEHGGLERITTLAEVGVVFLMFGIGLHLSVRKLQRLGVSLLLAVGVSAIVIFYLTRIGGSVLGAFLGWGGVETLFLAAMLMVSSSAIISKILREVGATHERSGQTAMGVMVLEDIVAVVMLTVLASVVHVGGAQDGASVFGTLGRLGAFVVLAGVGGLLAIPWLLKRMSLAADGELQTLGLGGLLFGLALLAHEAGYSLALGAFLLGTIVAETPHRTQVERTFEGMRDIFSAVFFVAIGMQIEPGLLKDSAWLIVGVSVFSLIVRPLAVGTGLSLIGTPPREALRTGLTVTPIGEFSFIIAQFGVTQGVVPGSFYPLAVGVSLLTTLAAPALTRNSERIADAALARQPRWLEDWLKYYQEWLEQLQARSKRNLFWQLSRKRLIQVSVGMLLVTGLVVYSQELFALAQGWLGKDWLFPNGLAVIFWSTLTLLVMAPLVAIWRNLSAMALLYAEMSTRGNEGQRKLRPIVEAGLKIAAGTALFFWLMSILPAEGMTRWLLVSSSVVAIAALFLLRRKLILWHSEMEVELQQMLSPEKHVMTATTAPWLKPHEAWELQMVDCLLPDLAECQGRTIASLELRSRFGCTVVGIERQGFMIPLPGPEAVLYPRDKVLLMGTADQVQRGQKFLGAVSPTPAAHSVFEEVCMEAVPVAEASPVCDRMLGELAIAKHYGVLVAGINRGGLRILNPAATESLRPGDDVLALGTPDQIRRFKIALREAEPEPAAEPAK